MGLAVIHKSNAGILERVGDSNTRMKDTATEAVIHLASVPAVNLAQATGLLVKCACYLGYGSLQGSFFPYFSSSRHLQDDAKNIVLLGIAAIPSWTLARVECTVKQQWCRTMPVSICRPLKATAGWKPLLQRLQLLGGLLPMIGITRSLSQPGFSLEGLIRIVTAALGNSNAEVHDGWSTCCAAGQSFCKAESLLRPYHTGRVFKHVAEATCKTRKRHIGRPL